MPMAEVQSLCSFDSIEGYLQWSGWHFLFSMEVVARVVRGFWAKLESLRTKIMEFSCFFFRSNFEIPRSRRKIWELKIQSGKLP